MNIFKLLESRFVAHGLYEFYWSNPKRIQNLFRSLSLKFFTFQNFLCNLQMGSHHFDDLLGFSTLLYFLSTLLELIMLLNELISNGVRSFIYRIAHLNKHTSCGWFGLSYDLVNISICSDKKGKNLREVVARLIH